jgi:hypothetical protein
MTKDEIRIEKGNIIVWNRKFLVWFAFIQNSPIGYFKTKKEAVSHCKKFN